VFVFEVARIPTLSIFMLCLLACAGTREMRLVPIPEAIPTGVSLEGRWELSDDGDAARKVREAEQRAAESVSDALAPSRKENTGRSKGKTSVHVFLETGRKLKITQTRDGLFVSFDRSVVEEYRFREHRVISVGPIEAERVSGWQQDRYVIKTLDDEGALLTETYGLVDAGAVLERTIRIVYKEKELLNIRQRFDRVG
jgi:hypothetical protein